MGQILLQALTTTRFAAPSTVWGVTKTASSAKLVQRKCGVRCYSSVPSEVLKCSKLIILAVKPSQVRSVLSELVRRGLPSSALIISVVTGVSCADLEAIVGKKTAVIRVMTNTACRIGQAISLLVPGSKVRAGDIRTAHAIFSHLGKVVQVEEQHCEALTGLAGSGPAFIFLIIEALADGGVNVGLPRSLALQVAAQAVLGASQMVLQSGRHPASLRDEVTTPAGCTIAGLLVMEDGKLRSTLARAVEEATRVARSLGQQHSAA